MRRGAGGLVARATEADFVRMKEHLDAFERATDQQSFREAGYAFHLEIARATRNPLLVRIFEMIIEARARAGGTSFAISTTTVRRSRSKSNRRVLQALRDRDTARARQLMRAHLWSMIADVAGPVQRD
jgi:GntR family transcriptional regulator, uxu operon transcriptional repressor